MAFTDEVRTARDGILSAFPEFAATVVIDGTSGTGLRVTELQGTDFGENGEVGQTTGTVRVSGATFSRPARGATILIDGTPATVTECDGSGILWVIQYRLARKVEGID